MSNVKATILLPVLNNEGADLEKENTKILADTLIAFGGYTADDVTGAYIMDDGRAVYDESSRLVIIIDKLRVPELRAMVKQWGKLLRQEIMYLDVEPSNVEFVKSAE